MGFSKTITMLSGLAIVGLAGAMAITNPDHRAYESYATQKLTGYLEENVCPEIPSILGDLLSNQCGSLLRDNQSQIQKIISNNTIESNFVVFSLYRTQLAIPEVEAAPSYEFETLGIFQRFFTFKAKQT